MKRLTGLTLFFYLMLSLGCSGDGGSGGGTSAPSVSSQQKTTDEASALLKKSWSNTPIPFYLSSTIPDHLVQPILDSFDHWEEAVGKQMFEFRGFTDSAAHQFDGQNVIYWSLPPSPKGYLGETLLMIRDEVQMLEADIVFYGNPNSFQALSCPVDSNGALQTICTSSADKFDVTTTALHEIGHFLGLSHTDEEDSIMNPDFGINSVIHQLDQDMLAEVKQAYNPTSVAFRAR